MIPYITLGERMIPMYGICCTLGIVAAALVGLILMRKRGICFADLVLSACSALTGGLIGAKLLFFIVSYEWVAHTFATMSFGEALLSVMAGGFVFYGGLIGGIVGLLLFVKIEKCNFWDFFEMYAVFVPLAHAFGRVGCFFAGCCYGIEYSGFPSHTYPANDWYLANMPHDKIGVSLLSVQLIEATCLLLLFAVLFILHQKSYNLRGLTVVVYAGAYSVIRFVIEFFRGDKVRGSAFGISTSQIISLLVFAAAVAIVILMILHAKKKKAAKESNPNK